MFYIPTTGREATPRPRRHTMTKTTRIARITRIVLTSALIAAATSSMAMASAVKITITG